MSGVEAEIMALKSDPDGQPNVPMYGPLKPGLVVRNGNRLYPVAVPATLKIV